MKIVLYDPNTHGHHLKYVSYVADSILKNHQLMFITLRIDKSVKELQIQHPRLIVKTLDTKPRFGDGTIAQVFSSLRNTFKAFGVAEAWGADVFHFAYSDSEFFPLPLVLTFFKPVSFRIFATTIWLDLFKDQDGAGDFKRVIFHVRRLLSRYLFKTKHAGGIFVHSTCPQYTEKTLLAESWLARSCKEKLTFLLDPFYDAKNEAYQSFSRLEARIELELPKDKVLLLFFGLLTHVKGLDILLKSVSEISPKYDFKLIIAGENRGYTDGYLDCMIREFNISHRVILKLGRVPEEEVPLYFVSSNVIVLPYRLYYRQGSSGLIQQACLAGRPIIASDIGTIGQVVKNYSLGIATTPESIESLKDAIEKFLVADKSKLKSWADNALNYASSVNYCDVSEAILKNYQNSVLSIKT